jgi:hypothetical protein
VTSTLQLPGPILASLPRDLVGAHETRRRAAVTAAKVAISSGVERGFESRRGHLPTSADDSPAGPCASEPRLLSGRPSGVGAESYADLIPGG